MATESASVTLSGIKAAAGGSFLIDERQPEEIFTPEDFSEEQRQIAETTRAFAIEEVLPALDAIEHKDFQVTRRLLLRAGELGLMSTEVPEEYGGLAMDKVASAIIAEYLSVVASFTTAFSAHVTIGMLPLIWYGTAEQKQRYLSKLASAEWIAAYALSEASSASDAMKIKTSALLSADGTHYLLNGEKQWITNAGFADLFTIFAKVDGEKFTAFLVERTSPGLSVGKEEHKLGIRGSSTCPLVLSDCRVPAENVLGEVGKGHHIAFNALNIGRFKLGAGAVGGAKVSLGEAIRYAKQRKAFGKTIADFGLIQQKIAECAVGIYVGESMAYRTVGMIDAAIGALDPESAAEPRAVQKCVEEYAVECSMLKVWGSEMLDRVVDQSLQIFGGYGYVEDYPAERAYRDSRINRIFEGTNEINRLIITGWLIKRAMSGQLPLLQAIGKVMEGVMSSSSEDETVSDDPLATEASLLGNLKKVGLFTAGAASQKYMQTLSEQQEVMGDLADIFMQIYALESAILRTRKLAKQGRAAAAKVATAMVKLFAEEALAIVEQSGRRVLAAVADGDTLRTHLAIFRRLTRHLPENSVSLSREIAKHMLDQGLYRL